MEKVSIFGVEIDNVTFNEAMEKIKEFLQQEDSKRIYTPNTEIAISCKDNESLKSLVNEGDLIIPDGIGLIYGSRIRKKPLKERVTGFDVSREMLKYANEKGLSLYLLGAKPGYTEKAIENIKKEYPSIVIAGHHHGYFKGTHVGEKGHREEEEIIEEINKAKPDIIFVGLGFPKQEQWIHENIDKIKGKVIIGNGGVIDILAGQAKRAPELFIKLNLEWLYRLITDPSRIKRQLAIPKFLFYVIVDKDSVK